MDDYYSTIIRQRDAAEAARLLADDCRKKDATIKQIRDRLELVKRELEKTCSELIAELKAATTSEITFRAQLSGALLAYRRALRLLKSVVELGREA